MRREAGRVESFRFTGTFRCTGFQETLEENRLHTDCSVFGPDDKTKNSVFLFFLDLVSPLGFEKSEHVTPLRRRFWSHDIDDQTCEVQTNFLHFWVPDQIRKDKEFRTGSFLFQVQSKCHWNPVWISLSYALFRVYVFVHVDRLRPKVRISIVELHVESPTFLIRRPTSFGPWVVTS